jgi:hypothetical protein
LPLKNSLLIISFLLSHVYLASAQITDDSTKLVYGPTTSVYTYEKYVQEIDSIFFPIDTALSKVAKFEFIQESSTPYQNLGANGTALKSVYYQMPKAIGKSSGYEAFTPYFKTTEAFKYYNTRSPFMDLDIGLGSKNRNTIDFSFSRNVNPHLNVGFDIHRLNSDKQIGAQSKIGDNNVLSSTVDLYTYYFSKNKKYTLLFHTLKFTHKVQETGGINVDDISVKPELYQYLDADIKLRNAGVQDIRVRHHLFQQYSLKPFFQIYYIVDKISQENIFSDFSLSSTTDYYQNFFISSDTTNEISTFNEIKNQAGIKGKFSSKLFYNAYLKRRDLDFNHNNTGESYSVGENYIGGKIKYIHNENNDIETGFELLSSGEYFFEGRLNNKFFKAAYSSSVYQPSYFVEKYSGNHYDWTNGFNSTFVNTIEGSIDANVSILNLNPKVSISTIDDYIYFDSDKAPKQAGLALINNYSLGANIALKNNLHFENNIVFNDVSGDGADAFRIPKWLVNSRWYYDGIAFNDYMRFQIGFDLKWQSGFYAKGYDPITQQFFNQSELKTESYLVADLFFVFKAKKARIFAKMTHINQATEGGYMATPFYPGQQRVFDLGIHWLFFD